MRVLLINPAWPSGLSGAKRYHRAWPPLDLLSTASLLRARGHEPILLDARAEHIGLEKMLGAMSRVDLILLTTSPLDRWQCPDLNWAFLGEMVGSWPRDRLVVSGAHGTVRPELILTTTQAGAVVRGEPEAALTELAAAGGNPRGLAGFSHMTGGRIVHEADRPPLDLDDLPPPAYDLLNLSRYRYELLGDRLALIETARGCPFTCIFCLKAMFSPGLRTKSLERVMIEVEEVVARRGARHVYFIDLEFTLKRGRIIELCRMLANARLKFNWCCQTRVDTVDPDLLAAMKEAGCRLIHFGVETGAPRLLTAIRKGITLDQIGRAFDWCRRLGLATAAFFLFGLPGETPADRRATVNLAVRLNPTFASFHMAAPYPGTVMARPNDADPFPACLSDEHNLSDLARQARRAFLSFYLRPGYIWGRLHEGSWREKANRLRLFLDFIR